MGGDRLLAGKPEPKGYAERLYQCVTVEAVSSGKDEWLDAKRVSPAGSSPHPELIEGGER